MTFEAILQSETAQWLRGLFPAGSVYFVGGLVRDNLLASYNESPASNPNPDYDLAVNLPPEELLAKLGKEKLVGSPKGQAMGSFAVHKFGKRVQLTVFREEQGFDGRYAQTRYTTDIATDAKRRDFTANALYLGLDGQLLDPLALALEDLKQKRLRFITEANRSIQQDGIRLFRWLRFHDQLGWPLATFEPSEAALVSAKKLRSEKRLEAFLQHIQKAIRAEAMQKIEPWGLMVDLWPEQKPNWPELAKAVQQGSSHPERLGHYFSGQIPKLAYLQ